MVVCPRPESPDAGSWSSASVHDLPPSRVRVPYSPFFLEQVREGHVKEITSKGTAIQGNFTQKQRYAGSEPAVGTAILHLGMSGSLRVLPPDTPAGKHDHFDLLLGDRMLRLRDPRRFGAGLWAILGAGIEGHGQAVGRGADAMAYQTFSKIT